MTTGAGSDRAHLAHAIAAAGRARGTTSPNPAVGCVIGAGGRVLGVGVTAAAGGPHAEIRALEEAGEGARGATAYVSLAPCGHHGRTPPCAEALLGAGVSRVVVAVEDPDAAASVGLGILRTGGADVEVLSPCDLLARTAALQLEGHLTSTRLGRPHVTVKLAQTTAGALTVAGRRWITGAAARTSVHRGRQAADGVLVGIGTVLADDPRLDVRLPGATPVDGDRDGRPRPVVLDSRLRIPPDAAVVRPGTIVVTTDEASEERAERLTSTGVEVVTVPAEGGRVDAGQALRALGDRGMRTVYAEPGRTLAQELLRRDLVDRLVLHIASGPGPQIPDELARRAVRLPDPRRWVLERSGGIGPDAVHQMRRERSGCCRASREAA